MIREWTKIVFLQKLKKHKERPKGGELKEGGRELQLFSLNCVLEIHEFYYVYIDKINPSLPR